MSFSVDTETVADLIQVELARCKDDWLFRDDLHTQWKKVVAMWDIRDYTFGCKEEMYRSVNSMAEQVRWALRQEATSGVIGGISHGPVDPDMYDGNDREHMIFVRLYYVPASEVPSLFKDQN